MGWFFTAVYEAYERLRMFLPYDPTHVYMSTRYAREGVEYRALMKARQPAPTHEALKHSGGLLYVPKDLCEPRRQRA
jgi:hypothetical protein